jgi:adenylate cyclase
MHFPRVGRSWAEWDVAVEAALAHEILVSERLRMGIIAGALAVAISALVFVRMTAPDVFEASFRGGVSVERVIALFACALAYELIARTVIGYFLRRHWQPPLIARYVNALVETSLPTVGTIVAVLATDPLEALVFPPSTGYFLFVILSTLRLDFWLSVFTGSVAAVEYTALALYYLGTATSVPPTSILGSNVYHIARGLSFLLAGVLAGLVGSRIRSQVLASLRVLDERNQIRSTFGQHVSPAVAERLLTHDLQLGGEVRRVCVMFLDIRGFTAFAEQHTPNQVVDYLNGLFAFMVERVNANHGIVNKFLGDGFMAVFGAPLSDGHDCRNAVTASLEILGRLADLNAATELPPTRVGIGLHTGPAVTGTVGSDLRREYTVIGDVVNLAARVEQLNKEFGSQLLISEPVYAAVDGAYDAEPLGVVSVRGHEAPIRLYRLA